MAQKAATAPPVPKVKPTMSDADWRAFDQQWCAATQPLREIVESGRDVHPMVFSAWLPSDEESKRMADLLSLRTQQALNAKGDVASQAVGLWWRTMLVPPQDFSALQSFALSTQDPLALALASQQRGTAPLALKWLQLEPHNLAAIWAADRAKKLPLEAMLERVSLATSNDNRLAEAFRRLEAVGLPSKGGFLELTQQTLAVGAHAAAGLPTQAMELARGCGKATSPRLQASCEQAAERIWTVGPDDAVGAVLVLSMVRPYTARSPVWDERARSVEAMLQAEREDGEASIRELVRASACLPSPLMQSMMRARLTQGPWTWWRTRLNDPDTVTALSERYRAANGGKGLLTPRP